MIFNTTVYLNCNIVRFETAIERWTSILYKFANGY